MKKKIIICVVALVCIGAIVAGIGFKAYKKAYTPVDYGVKSIAGTDLAQNGELKLIAHRGFRAIAPENTIPAYQRAGEAGYWGAECDIYRTTDGVWVLMHDDTVNRMTDGKGKVEKKSYEELKEYTIDNGNSVDSYYDTKIPTLDEYLAECERTNLTAFIELKGKNNIDYYSEIIDTAKKYKVSVVYIAFGADNLKAIRKLDDKSQMFFLVGKIDDNAIKTAKELGNCGVNFNASEKDNFKNDGAAIKKISEEGLPSAAWTVDDIETVETLVGYGVTYITTDCITY